jgi:hypothetical protein
MAEHKQTAKAVQDFYRCPERFLDPGTLGNLFWESFLDVLPEALLTGIKPTARFHPTEVIDHLRLERYVGGADGQRKLLKQLYYLLRPLTSLSVRRRIQKFQARNWRNTAFPRWPVDTTVEDVCERMLLLSLCATKAEKIPFVWFWPRGARGCVMMTHDVENHEGLNFCTELMEIDESFGIKASFQVVPETRYSVSAGFLETIRDCGFEPVIHDLNHDGQLFDDREEFVRRANKINSYAREYGTTGFRAAVLYRNPEWIELLDISYDMSIPNVAHLDPQQGGCCTVMPYFIGNILELPVTTVQDYMLMHMLNERSIDLWKSQTEMILQKNGLVSFIVHPDYVIEPEAKSLYKALLCYLRSPAHEDVWFALPKDVDCWWRTRDQLSIVPDGSSWKIEGEGAERACLAFAKEVDGKLVYELA